MPDWSVEETEAGLRLDKFLAAPARAGSRAKAVAALERGKVFVNDAEVALADAGRRLSTGDRVRLWMDRPGSSKPRVEPANVGDIRILHEDDSILVIDKPPGMLTVPLDRRPGAVSARELLERRRPSGRRERLFVVHRIDEYTSGLVLFARDPIAQTTLKDQFRQHLPERIYRAVVYGHPSPEAGTWRDFIVWDDRAMIQKEAHPRDPEARQAVSRYRVLDQFSRTSLIEVQLETGKRNQIRLQARLRGHTLVGEQRYVYGPDELRTISFPRQALHAYRLSFRHPRLDREVQFEAPLPDDLRGLIERLRRRQT